MQYSLTCRYISVVLKFIHTYISIQFLGICVNKVLRHIQITTKIRKYCSNLKKTITFNWLNRIRRRQRKQIDDQKAILHSQIKAIQGQILEKSTDLLDKKIVDSVEKVGKIYFASIIPRANALKRESEEH